MNDLRSCIRFITENLFAKHRFEPFDHILRKTVGICRHRMRRDNARDFPMSSCRVLSAREFTQAGKGADRTCFWPPASDTVNVKKTKFCKIGREKFRRLYNRCQRVAVAVAKFFCVWLAPDAHAVKNDEKHALKGCLHFSLLLSFLTKISILFPYFIISVLRQ